tara:strand:+ start:3110 stop:3955 length:846 start_codon:yes stop_codon:yes gene_type:complete
MLKIPNFNTQKELLAFIVENKETLTTQKKSAIKYADGIGVSTTQLQVNKQDVNKSDADENTSTDLTVKVVINTTGILDSHGDVHAKGIWNKSIKENTRIMHVQEHKSYEFDKIISSGEDLSVSVKSYPWKTLGYDAEGSTQALVFDSTVKEARNPYMYNQYKKGYVDNHSVGMRYVKMELAVNDTDYEKEKAFWDKHIENVVNKEEAEQKGFFWVIFEAKVIEGSAVPSGSNPITPTINTKSEPSLLEMIGKVDTQETKAAVSTFNVSSAISKININLKNN